MKLRMTFAVRFAAGLITLTSTLAWARWLLEAPAWLCVLTAVGLGLLMFWVLGLAPRHAVTTRRGRRGLAWQFVVLGSLMALLSWGLIGSPWSRHDVAIGTIGFVSAAVYLVAAVVEFGRLRRERLVASIDDD